MALYLHTTSNDVGNPAAERPLIQPFLTWAHSMEAVFWL
jgi:hypothetical protein